MSLQLEYQSQSNDTVEHINEILAFAQVYWMVCLTKVLITSKRIGALNNACIYLNVKWYSTQMDNEKLKFYPVFTISRIHYIFVYIYPPKLTVTKPSAVTNKLQNLDCIAHDILLCKLARTSICLNIMQLLSIVAAIWETQAVAPDLTVPQTTHKCKQIKFEVYFTTTAVHNVQTWQKFSKAACSSCNYPLNTVKCLLVKQP